MGQVAMVYHSPIPKIVEIHNHQYAFVVKFGISLAYVDDGDLLALERFKAGCCGQEHVAFKKASANQIKVWETGHY